MALNATVGERKRLRPGSDHTRDCGGCFRFRQHTDARSSVLRQGALILTRGAQRETRYGRCHRVKEGGVYRLSCM